MCDNSKISKKMIDFSNSSDTINNIEKSFVIEEILVVDGKRIFNFDWFNQIEDLPKLYMNMTGYNPTSDDVDIPYDKKEFAGGTVLLISEEIKKYPKEELSRFNIVDTTSDNASELCKRYSDDSKFRNKKVDNSVQIYRYPYYELLTSTEKKMYLGIYEALTAVRPNIAMERPKCGKVGFGSIFKALNAVLLDHPEIFYVNICSVCDFGDTDEEENALKNLGDETYNAARAVQSADDSKDLFELVFNKDSDGYTNVDILSQERVKGMSYSDNFVGIEFAYMSRFDDDEVDVTKDDVDAYSEMLDLEMSVYSDAVEDIMFSQTVGERIDALKDLHDLILSEVSYNLDAANNQSIFGALMIKQTVCAGYSKLFALLCHNSGIPCYVVHGIGGTDSKELHAWNILYLDGMFYNVDVTWGKADVVEIGYMSSVIFSNLYFMKSDSDYGSTHVRCGMSRALPACTGNYTSVNTLKYEVLTEEGCYDESIDAIIIADKGDDIETLMNFDKSGYVDTLLLRNNNKNIVLCCSNLSILGMYKDNLMSTLSDIMQLSGDLTCGMIMSKFDSNIVCNDNDDNI